mgnify:CR=1 FL=1
MVRRESEMNTSGVVEGSLGLSNITSCNNLLQSTISLSAINKNRLILKYKYMYITLCKRYTLHSRVLHQADGWPISLLQTKPCKRN